MEKKRVIHKIVLVILFGFGIASHSFGQNFTSTDEQVGSWSEPLTWSGSPSANFLNGDIDVPNTHATISGTVTVGSPGSPMSLTIYDSTTFTIDDGDTLEIWGNLTFTGGVSNIELSGFLSVHGNFIIESTITANIAGSTGFLSVAGNFENNGTCNYSSSSSNVYVIGNSSSPIDCTDPSSYDGISYSTAGSCAYGNLEALIINEDPSTIILVLGETNLAVSLEITNAIHCIGGSDGEITATATGGSWSGYEYSIDNTNWVNSNVFSGLKVGSKTIYVRDDDSNTTNATIVITQPAVFNFSGFENERPFSCDDGSGVIDPKVTGGTRPYIISVVKGAQTMTSKAWKVIYTSTKAETDYQVLLNLDYVPGMNTDFTKLEIRDANRNLLPYWIESFSTGTSAKIWVRVPYIGIGSNTLLVSWSNTGTSVASNLGTTMNSGGLNVTVFPSTTDLTGADSLLCTDTDGMNNAWATGDIQFDCMASPDNDGISVRWSGWLNPPAANAYYGIRYSDGARLYINNTLYVDDMSSTDTSFFSTGELNFTKPVPIVVEYNYNSSFDGALMHLGYKTGSAPADSSELLDISSFLYYQKQDTIVPSNFIFQSRFDSLSPGAYRVFVTDDCGAGVGVFKDYTISQDSIPPVITIPPDYFIYIDDYKAANLQDVVLNNDLENGWTDDPTYDRFNFSGGELFYYGKATETEESRTIAISTLNYEHVELSLTARQENDGWENTDFLKIEVSYNGGSDWIDTLVDKCQWNAVNDVIGEGGGQTGNTVATSFTLLLDDRASDNENFMVRLTCHIEGDARNYVITDFSVVADERYHTISPTLESGVATATDDYRYRISYSDSRPDISCDSLEFTFTRTWTATDSCGRTDQGDQMLRVGTRPVIDQASVPADTIFDFCHANQQFNAPTATDSCTAPGEIIISWAIQDKTNGDTLAWGLSNPTSAFDFPPNDTLEIIWTATDKVGITQTDTTQVIVLDSVRISFEPNVGPDVCLDQTVEFTLTVTGGTGLYNYDSFTPAGGIWADPYYTTDQLTQIQRTLDVTVTDQNISGVQAGCQVTHKSSPLNVHQLVQTNEIKRKPK